MNDRIPMTVFQSTAYLSSEFPGGSFSESTMRDNIVEHLSTVDYFVDHVVVIGVSDEFPHTADIGVVK